MGVVDDGYEHLAFVVDFPSGFNQQFFPACVPSFDFDAEGFAEDVQGVRVGMQCPGDGRSDHLFGVVIDDGLFDDAFARAGFTHDQAKPALLSMNFDGFKYLLLMRNQLCLCRGLTVL